MRTDPLPSASHLKHKYFEREKTTYGEILIKESNSMGKIFKSLQPHCFCGVSAHVNFPNLSQKSQDIRPSLLRTAAIG